MSAIFETGTGAQHIHERPLPDCQTRKLHCNEMSTSRQEGHSQRTRPIEVTTFTLHRRRTTRRACFLHDSLEFPACTINRTIHLTTPVWDPSVADEAEASLEDCPENLPSVQLTWKATLPSGSEPNNRRQTKDPTNPQNSLTRSNPNSDGDHFTGQRLNRTRSELTGNRKHSC